MTEMQESHWSSTNGRWGLTIISPNKIQEGQPFFGRLTDLGKVAGFRTFSVQEPGESGASPDECGWFVVVGDGQPLVGATRIESLDLQSSNSVNLFSIAAKFAAIKTFGYKGRSSHVSAWVNGESLDLSPQMMAAMGLIPADGHVVQVEPDPVLPDALQSALMKAGLA